MPNNDQNNSLTGYLDKFQEELYQISTHMEALAERLVPQVRDHLKAIEQNTEKMTAYSGSGASRAQGIDPAKGGTNTQAVRAVNPPTGPASKETTKAERTIDRALRNPQGGDDASTSGGGWLGRVSENKGFRLPQFGQLTVQDTLEYVSGILAGKANTNRVNSDAYKELDAMTNEQRYTDASKTTLTPEAQKLSNALNSGNHGGGRWGSASNGFNQMASGYATGKVVSTLAKQAASPIMNARNLAYLTGYTGSSQQGFMGITMPWAGPVGYGLGQEASQMGFALNNSLSPSQAHAIYSNLFSQGWYGGPSTNAMRQGLANLTQANPLLGTDPQVAQMMDQTTRMGQTSINTFVDTMKQIPQAADAAHVSLQQMVSDSQALGQWAVQNGGNFINGMQSANAWTSVTGTPASVMGTMMGNPMVQGQMFMRSGLLPWEQGLAPFGSQVGGVLSSLDLFKNAIHLPSITQHDSIGLTNTISSSDRTAALISHYFGISSAAAKNLLQHQKGVVAGTQAWQNATDYQSSVVGALNKGDYTKAGNRLNGPAWNALYKQLGSARDSQGNLMFDKADKWRIQHAGDRAVVDAIQKAQDKGGVSGVRASKLMTGFGKQWTQTQGYGKNPQTNNLAHYIEHNPELTKLLPRSVVATIAKDRSRVIKNIVGQHTQQTNQGPQITVGLTPQAAKALKLKGPTGLGKQAAGAGGSQVNIPYGQGYSDTPSPNLDTAGNSWGSSGGL